MKKGFTLIEMMIVVAIIAIIAAIAIPSLLAARRNAKEANAVAALNAYSSAQTTYIRNDWDLDGILEYATPYPDLYNRLDSQGKRIKIIDAAFAAAAGAAGIPKAGYVFDDMVQIGGVNLADLNGNWSTDYAMSGIPFAYGKDGYRTFIICTEGMIYARDLGLAGGFVLDYPADPQAAGWLGGE